MLNMGQRDELRQFLKQARFVLCNDGDDSSRINRDNDGSIKFRYGTGDWEYLDQTFIGEPFGGMDVVRYKGKPVWMLVYYGWVEPEVIDPKMFYTFLRAAMQATSEESESMRGPEWFYSGDTKLDIKIALSYNHVWSGDYKRFEGNESIYGPNGQRFYYASYQGGLIDQRSD